MKRLGLAAVGLVAMLLVHADLRGQEQTAATSNEGQDGKDRFVVIVNAKNTTTSMERSRLAKVYLKKIKRWDEGERIIAFDLDASSEVRVAFIRAIHGKSATAIDSYWQRMIFSGRDVPPQEVASDEGMIAEVAADVRAIGYVSANASLPKSVQVLEVTSK